jgi:uncharacterized protein with NRDE domain
LRSLLGAAEAELMTTLTELLGDRTPAPDHLLPSTGLDPQRERAASASFIPGETYGTRASTIVLVAADGRVVFRELLFGPCGTPQGTTELEFELSPAAALQGEA